MSDQDDKPRRTATCKYVRPTLRLGPSLPAVTAIPMSPGDDSIVSDCWVARAAFGAGDFRWMIFRAWLLDDAPTWFRSLYFRHGPTIGDWLVPRPGARAAVRSMMMGPIRRKLSI